MRLARLGVAFCLSLSSLLDAQSPLTTLTGGTNQGNIGGGIYFDLEIASTVTITQFTLYTGVNTVPGTGRLDVYLGPSTYAGNLGSPGQWVLVASAENLAVGPNAMVPGVLTTPFALAPGNYGVALRSNGFNHGYTNGVGCTSTTVPGACSNATFATAEMTLRAGAAQNSFLNGAIFTPRVWNGAIHYTPGGTPIAAASWEPFGSGCYAWYHSFYETFSNPTLSYDLGNATGGTNSLTLHFTSGGYLVLPFSTTGTYFPPTAAATDLLLGDDTTALVTLPWPLPFPTPAGAQTTTQLEVCSNGFLSPAGSNGTAAIPTAAAFLSGQPRWGNWHDFDPGSGGRVTFEVDPAGQAVYVTWENMPTHGVPSSISNWQCKLAHTGTVEFRWRAMSLGGGGAMPALVGWTPGGGVMDPGSIDLTASPAFATGPTDNPPLTLALSARPRLGTTPDLITSQIPAGTTIGGVVVSLAGFDPGLPLLGIRMPGCNQYVDLNLGATIAFFPTGGAASVALPIPASMALDGVRIWTQSATVTSGYNALGMLSSQGVRLLLGIL